MNADEKGHKQPYNIQVPIHPTEQALPRSDVRLRLSGGEVVEMLGVPLQGPRTLESVLRIWEIWKPNIVVPDLDYQL